MDHRPPATEPVNLAGIAKMAQVSRPTVSNWRRRHRDFPQPVDEGAGAVIFERSEIERWLQRHGKPYSRPSLVQQLWNAFAAMRDQTNSDAVLSAARDLVSAMTTDAMDDSASRTADSAADSDFLHLVRDLVSTHGPSDVFEALLDASRRHDGSWDQHVTPPSIARLLVALAQPIAGTVHDPACGMGSLLLAASRSVEPNAITKVTGTEHAGPVRHIALRRLAAHGIDAQLKLGNTLTEWPPAPLADVVLTDPPWHQTWQPPAAEGQWFAGVSPASNADMAWLQASINRLSPSGKAFHITPASPLHARGRQAAIRQELVTQGCVHAIVQLPAGIYHPRTSIRTFVWVLSRPRTEPAEVLFIDASEAGYRIDRHRTELRDSDVAAIATLYQGWAQDQSSPDPSLPHQTVPAAALLGSNNCDLSPDLWLPESGDPEAAVRQLQSTFDDLTTRWADLQRSDAPSLEVAPLARGAPVVTVRELIDAGAVRMIRSRRLEKVAETGQTPLVTAPDLGHDWTVTRTKFVDPDLLPDDVQLTEPGDVLATAAGSLRVAVDEAGGAVVAAPVHVLRCHQDRLEPLVLAALLTSSSNSRHDRGVSLMHRDLLSMEVPLLDVASQQTLAERLNTLVTLYRQANDLVRSTEEAKTSLVDVVATGSFTVSGRSAGIRL